MLPLHMKEPLGSKVNFEKHKLPQARSTTIVWWGRQTAHELTTVPYLFQGRTSTQWWREGGRMGACWRTLRPLSYTKQMRPGVELLYLEFLGKPQLTGKAGRMRIWVHCNLLCRPIPSLIHMNKCTFIHSVHTHKHNLWFVTPCGWTSPGQHNWWTQPPMTEVFYVPAFFVVQP